MKKLLSLYKSFSREKQITVGVVLVHLTLLFMLSCHHLITSRLKPPRPMIVKTISPVAPSAAPAILPVKEKPVFAEVQPKKSISPPKPSEKMVKKIDVPKPTKKAETSLGEIAKSFETLGSDTKKKSPSTLAVPKKVAPVLREQEIVDDVRYEEFLIAFLQESLDLPEFGQVRLKLEIDGGGKLIDCQILEAKSAKNAEFLKNRLPELAFPCLNDFGKISATQTFNITFRNVETH